MEKMSVSKTISPLLQGTDLDAVVQQNAFLSVEKTSSVCLQVQVLV